MGALEHPSGRDCRTDKRGEENCGTAKPLTDRLATLGHLPAALLREAYKHAAPTGAFRCAVLARSKSVTVALSPPAWPELVPDVRRLACHFGAAKARWGMSGVSGSVGRGQSGGRSLIMRQLTSFPNWVRCLRPGWWGLRQA